MNEIARRLTAVVDLDNDGTLDGLEVVGTDPKDPEEGWMVAGPWPRPMPLKALIVAGMRFVHVTGKKRPVFSENHPKLDKLLMLGLKASEALRKAG